MPISRRFFAIRANKPRLKEKAELFANRDVNGFSVEGHRIPGKHFFCAHAAFFAIERGKSALDGEFRFSTRRNEPCGLEQLGEFDVSSGNGKLHGEGEGLGHAREPKGDSGKQKREIRKQVDDECGL